MILDNIPQVSSGNGTAAEAPPSVIWREYLTLEDLARELRTSPRTLMRWHALRMGPPRTVIGKKILYRIVAVQDWLKQREERRAR
jgi:hypothetical protein